MPLLAPVPGVVRVDIPAVLVGQPMVNTFHFQRNVASPAPWTQPDMQGLVNDVRDWWVTKVLPILVQSYVLQPLVLTDLTSDTGLKFAFGAIQPGAVPQKSLPTNAAMCVSWHQAQRYKGGHPRTYLGGIPENNSEDGRHFSVPSLNAFRGAFATLGFINPTGAEMVLVRRTVNKVLLAQPQVHRITGNHINARIDSQRRRLGKA